MNHGYMNNSSPRRRAADRFEKKNQNVSDDGGIWLIIEAYTIKKKCICKGPR